MNTIPAKWGSGTESIINQVSIVRMLQQQLLFVLVIYTRWDNRQAGGNGAGVKNNSWYESV